MGWRDLFSAKENLEEIIEVEAEETGEPVQNVSVRGESLHDFVDIDRITRFLKDGNIVFLKAKELQRRDLGEYQNCLQKLKRVSGQFGFGIAGTEEGYLILTPAFAKIER